MTVASDLVYISNFHLFKFFSLQLLLLSTLFHIILRVVFLIDLGYIIYLACHHFYLFIYLRGKTFKCFLPNASKTLILIVCVLRIYLFPKFTCMFVNSRMKIISISTVFLNAGSKETAKQKGKLFNVFINLN